MPGVKLRRESPPIATPWPTPAESIVSVATFELHAPADADLFHL
jgi:hypothetical protein